MATADTAKLIASLVLQDKGFSKGLSNAEKNLGKFESTAFRVGQHVGSGLQSAAKNVAILGAASAAVITTQVAAGIRSLADLERVQNQTAAVIKSTGGAAGVTATQVRDMAEALESVTTADDKLIQEGENLLLTFTNIGDKTFPRATKAMVDMSIAMADGEVEAADFGGTAIQLGKALNDPIKGITALSRVGVSFTKQQKDQIKAMTEAGDIAGAQAVILDELEKEFGEAGKAAGIGFGADMRRFGDAVEGAQQALARGFLPVISRVATVLNDRLSDPQVVANIERLGEGLAGGLESLISIAEKLPWEAIGTSFQIAGMGAKAILDAFVGLPPWVQTAVITGWGLNKLTGGALSGIVGELGKGLIKGVLGMNAGVVNINAATVNGPGGVPGAGGKGGGGIGGLIGAGARIALPAALFAGLSEGLGQVLKDTFGAAGGAAQNAAQLALPANFLQTFKTIGEKVDELINPTEKTNEHLSGVNQKLADSAVRDTAANERLEQIRAEQVAGAAKIAAEMPPIRSEMIGVRQSQAATIARLAADSQSERATIAAEAAKQASAIRDGTSETRAVAAAVRAKDLSVTTNVTIPLNVSVSDQLKATLRYKNLHNTPS